MLSPLSVSCGKARSPASSTQHALAELDPSVQSTLRNEFGPSFPSDAREVFLADFLKEAQLNDALSPRAPLHLISDDPSPRFSKIDVNNQRAIVLQARYSYITLGGESRIIVFSSDDNTLTMKSLFASRIFEWINRYLPTMDLLLGGTYEGAWLHVQLRSNASYSYTAGHNVFLITNAEDSEEVIVHELMHTYNSVVAKLSPTFISEGIAEAMALHLTGKSALVKYATGQKVRLDMIAEMGSRDYLTEAANGAVLFTNLLSIESPEVVFGAIGLAVEHELASGIDTLRVIKSKSNDKDAVEELFVRAVAGYEPGSS
jgi:hypothetical protein